MINQEFLLSLIISAVGLIKIIIIINIFIAQIPCEYDQMRVTNMIQIKYNKLRIPTGGRLTSWPFTRRGGVESSAIPLGHACLLELEMPQG